MALLPVYHLPGTGTGIYFLVQKVRVQYRYLYTVKGLTRVNLHWFQKMFFSETKKRVLFLLKKWLNPQFSTPGV